MTLHQIEFEYVLPEWGTLEMNIDETLETTEKESIAIREIKEVYPDIEDIKIISMKVIDGTKS
jgi:hypothetical protein